MLLGLGHFKRGKIKQQNSEEELSSWAYEMWETTIEEVGEVGQIAPIKTAGNWRLCDPSRCSLSLQEQSWGRSRFCQSPKPNFANCSILVVLITPPGAETIVRQATCAARACGWMHTAPIFNGASLCKPVSSWAFSCTLMHSATAKFRQQDTDPPVLCTSELWLLPQGQHIALGQINSLRQIYGTKSIPGAILLKSPGFHTWERCKAYCIKADFFFCLPFIYFPVNLKLAPLLMIYLCWAAHSNSEVSFFKHDVLLHNCSWWRCSID